MERAPGVGHRSLVQQYRAESRRGDIALAISWSAADDGSHCAGVDQVRIAHAALIVRVECLRGLIERCVRPTSILPTNAYANYLTRKFI